MLLLSRSPWSLTLSKKSLPHSTCMSKTDSQCSSGTKTKFTIITGAYRYSLRVTQGNTNINVVSLWSQCTWSGKSDKLNKLILNLRKPKLKA